MDATTLSKLNVAQLKAKCKELKISGYSKLSKQLLIDRLLASVAVTSNSENTIGESHTGTQSIATTTQGGATALAEESSSGVEELKGSTESTAKQATELMTEDTITGAAKVNTKKRPRKNGDEKAAKKKRTAADGEEKTTQKANSDISREAPLVARSDTRSDASAVTIPEPSPVTAGPPSLAPPELHASTDAAISILTSPPIVPGGRKLPLSSRRTGPKLAADSRPPLPALKHPVPSNPSLVQGATNRAVHGPASGFVGHPTSTPRSGVPARKPQTYKPQAFKAPTILRPPRAISPKPPVANTHHQEEHTPTGIDRTLDFAPCPPCTSFPRISMPPSMARRREAERMSVVFSGISDSSVLALCTRVSRAWRYAVHLSATHTLIRDYSGKRLEVVRTNIKEPRMTSMWAYLRARRQEAAERRDSFQHSWLGRFFGAHGEGRKILGAAHDPLSWRMWTSSDDERQTTVALRFVSTRVVFTLAKRHEDPSPARKWLDTTVVGAEEVVPNEVWKITTTRPASNRTIDSYVLFDTGEVIGHAPPHTHIVGRRVAFNRPHLEVFDHADRGDLPLRVDWANYVRACEMGGAPSLQDAMTSGDRESYVAGISAFWLRGLGGGQDVELLKTIARRYTLSCVEPNSVSGEYKDVVGMAREIAGAGIERSTFGIRRHLGLYISEHHLVESVHFTTRRQGKVLGLHPALALVFTAPGREYFVLRDMGMPVGTSDEGLELLWQKLIGCDAWGIPHMQAML